MDMIKYNTPQELFTAICDKIRDKIGSNELINHQDIPDKIDDLVDSDNIFVLKYNQTLSTMMNQSIITEISDNEIKSINISFDDNQDLVTINLPKCTYVCNFAYCHNLAIVNLPKCTSIGDRAFYDCTSLTTVNLPKCTSIGDRAFDSCTSLTTIDLPECTSIEVSAFENCTSLTTVNLPKCTSIGDNAFYGCTKMINVYLEGDSFIGDGAFENCKDLRNVYILASHVTTLGTNVFDNTPITGYGGKTGYIYVPDNLVNSYKSDTKWSTYADRIRSMNEA